MSLAIAQLPVRLTPLVGRASELDGIVEALGRSRLTTLVGAGGTGKTRLALAAARTAGPSYPAGVCWVALATSREAPGVEGEVSWPVPPLSLPTADSVPTAARLAGSDAVKLFEQRAQLVRPAFRVTDENAAAVFSICQRLDGLPLAIELAAARMRILSSAQLAERLDDIFAVLVGGARSAPLRHQALRATLDWSHDLLDAGERTVFRRLAVFYGGFTPHTAEQVASGDDIRPEMVLELLTRLSDKSLLRVEHGPGESRYFLLATIRDYAWEKLAEASHTDQVRRAHLRHFTELVERAAARIERVESEASRLELELDRLDAELPNLRQAFEFAQESGDSIAALRITGPLDRYAHLRGRYHEVRQRRTAGTGPDGEQVRYRGHGCAVVRAQPDGTWRIAADAWHLGTEIPSSQPGDPRGSPGFLL